MQPELKTGQFVHVVATLNLETGEGRIRYVNPATSTLAGGALPDSDVELVARDAAGTELARTSVVVRRSSPEPDQSNAVGLIQADIPVQADMQSIALVFKGNEVDRYTSGAPLPPTAGTAGLGLAPGDGVADQESRLSLDDLDKIQPAAGITYTVQVKPEAGGQWNTIAVGRSTPNVKIDGNQFPGSKTAVVKVIRTTGFEEATVAEGTVKLPN